MIHKFNRGDIYYYDFGDRRDGSVENKCRPAVIVSNNDGNHNGTVVTLAPITSRDKATLPCHVFFQGVSSGQVILLEQLRCVNVAKLLDFVGHLDEITIKKIDIALAIQLNLNIVENEITTKIFFERLDYSLDKILNSKFNNYDNILTKAITSLKEGINSDILTTIKTEIGTSNVLLEALKEKFNANVNNTDKVIGTLIELFKKLQEIPLQQETVVNIHTEQTEDIKPEVKIIERKTKSKMSKEHCLEFLKDYFTLSTIEVLQKYKLKESSVASKAYTCKKWLKDNGINFDKKLVINGTEEITEVSSDEKTGRNKVTKELALAYLDDYYTKTRTEMKMLYGVEGNNVCYKANQYKTWLKKNNIPFIEKTKTRGGNGPVIIIQPANNFVEEVKEVPQTEVKTKKGRTSSVSDEIKKAFLEDAKTMKNAELAEKYNLTVKQVSNNKWAWRQ